MSGLEKKKPDERMLGMISIELSMFMRWAADDCGRMLRQEEAEDIAKRILNREKFEFGKEEILQITSLAFASDVDKIDDFRKKTNFDVTIDGFCQSICIVKPWSAPHAKTKTLRSSGLTLYRSDIEVERGASDEEVISPDFHKPSTQR
jgi:hypothetical protein